LYAHNKHTDVNNAKHKHDIGTMCLKICLLMKLYMYAGIGACNGKVLFHEQ